jgi:hypothetical protein
VLLSVVPRSSFSPSTQYAAQLIIIISYHPGYSLFY